MRATLFLSEEGAEFFTDGSLARIPWQASWQDAEEVCQRRSCVAQELTVRPGTTPVLAAGEHEGLSPILQGDSAPSHTMLSVVAVSTNLVFRGFLEVDGHRTL